jgi:hypothetical protein
MLKVVSCSLDSTKENVFVMLTNKGNCSSGVNNMNLSEHNKYEISCNSNQESKIYVEGLNYISQLVKCKAYSFKGNINKIK